MSMMWVVVGHIYAFSPAAFATQNPKWKNDVRNVKGILLITIFKICLS
jgi:hypothetical protein